MYSGTKKMLVRKYLNSIDKLRRQEEMANGDGDDLVGEMEDDLTLDPDLQLELDRLKLEEVKLKQIQLQYEQRMLISEAEKRAAHGNMGGSRCVTGTTVVVRNSSEGNAVQGDADGNYSSGAGDSLQIPGLQRGAPVCVVCSGAANSHCERCRTPYCSERCQGRDWSKRHKDVCHNLARLNGVPKSADIETPALTVPLRRPHSPEGSNAPPISYQVHAAGDQKDTPDYQKAGSGNQEVAPTSQRNASGNQKNGPANQIVAPGNQRDAHNKKGTSSNKRNGSGSQKDSPGNQKNVSGNQRNWSGNQPDASNNQKEAYSYKGDSPGSQKDSSGNQKNAYSNQRDQNQRSNGNGGDSQHKRFTPAGHNVQHGCRGSGRKDLNSRPQGDNRQAGGRPPLRHEIKNQGTANDRPAPAKSFGHRNSNEPRYNRDGQIHTHQRPQMSTNGQTCGDDDDDEEEWNLPKPAITSMESQQSPSVVAKTNASQSQETMKLPLPVKNQGATPTTQAAEIPKQVAQPPKQEAPKQEAKVAPLCSIADVTPTPVKPSVPKECVIDTLSVSETVLLSVDNEASKCRSKAGGFVCLSLHEKVEADYEALCEDYGAACEADSAPYTLTPGESFSYCNPEDGAWYRARCLEPTLAALLDSSKVVSVSASDRCKQLPAKYRAIPEFCCLLQANVKIGDSLKCTLIAKTPRGFKVSLEQVDSGASVGEGEVSRWLPRVQPPAPKPASNPAAQAVEIPVVKRPDVTNNSKVFLVETAVIEKTFVVFTRPADIQSQRKFDAVLEEVVLYGQSATPLQQPPHKGQMVVGKFTDGLHYRALVKRTNVKADKYLLEYVEFGNTHVSTLDHLYACPPAMNLEQQPTMTSYITLQGKIDGDLTPEASRYLDKLKDQSAELTLILPNGSKTAPNGSAAVLTVVKTNEVVNRKLGELCTAEWKKFEERGGDVVEMEAVMYSDLEYLDFPAGGCELDILDISGVEKGALSGCQKGLPHAKHVFTHLTEQMNKYCKSALGREPYLPKPEELCIAQFPPYEQWFRAVFIGQAGGPGGDRATLCFVDYGNVEEVDVALLRKMLPEFVHDLPAVANTIIIKGFPVKTTPEMLVRAARHMKMDEEGRGTLRVTSCEKDTPGFYNVEAPELIAAMMSP